MAGPSGSKPGSKQPPAAASPAEQDPAVSAMSREAEPAVPGGPPRRASPRRRATAGDGRRAVRDCDSEAAPLPLQDVPAQVKAYLLTGRVVERRTEAGELQRGVVKHFWPCFGAAPEQPLGARPTTGMPTLPRWTLHGRGLAPAPCWAVQPTTSSHQAFSTASQPTYIPPSRRQGGQAAELLLLRRERR